MHRTSGLWVGGHAHGPHLPLGLVWSMGVSPNPQSQAAEVFF